MKLLGGFAWRWIYFTIVVKTEGGGRLDYLSQFFISSLMWLRSTVEQTNVYLALLTLGSAVQHESAIRVRLEVTAALTSMASLRLFLLQSSDLPWVAASPRKMTNPADQTWAQDTACPINHVYSVTASPQTHEWDKKSNLKPWDHWHCLLQRKSRLIQSKI